jgi:hypothetical protein
MLEGRDAILEGVMPMDVDQLRRLEQGGVDGQSADGLARLQAKGWIDSIGGVHLITLTGRTLLERSPYGLS